MQLVILASGTGSRLMPYTKDRPKCMVEFKGKSMIDYLTPAFKNFDEVICITGYKKEILRNHLTKVNNLKFANNDFYESRNMVYSLFCAKDIIKSDIIISYSDIIYDLQILEDLVKYENSTIPVNGNWLDVWKKRMKEDEIINDAENLEIENNKIKSIGGKIIDKMPEFQYMGILKVKFEDFLAMKDYFLSLDIETQSKIDMTSFINNLIAKKIVSFDVFKNYYNWIEIDSVEDIENLSV